MPEDVGNAIDDNGSRIRATSYLHDIQCLSWPHVLELMEGGTDSQRVTLHSPNQSPAPEQLRLREIIQRLNLAFAVSK